MKLVPHFEFKQFGFFILFYFKLDNCTECLIIHYDTVYYFNIDLTETFKLAFVLITKI